MATCSPRDEKSHKSLPQPALSRRSARVIPDEKFSSQTAPRERHTLPVTLTRLFVTSGKQIKELRHAKEFYVFAPKLCLTNLCFYNRKRKITTRDIKYDYCAYNKCREKVARRPERNYKAYM